VFQHFAYVLPKQLAFKESYYGYRGALLHWKKLQQHRSFPAKLKDFLPWVNDETVVGRVDDSGITPLISFDAE
jgi:hypothetical protein